MTLRSKRLWQMSRLTSTLKQNPVREPPSLLPPHTALTFSQSRSFLSLILSFCPYWAAKLSLSFTAYPGREGNNASTLCSPEYVLETQSGPLIPHILFLSFLSFFFLFHTPFLPLEGGGELKQARCKGKVLLCSLFSFFPPSSLSSCLVFAGTNTYTHSHTRIHLVSLCECRCSTHCYPFHQ